MGGLLDRAEFIHRIKELERLNQELTQEIEQLNALHKIARVVTTSLDLDVVLNRVVEAAVFITKAEEGSLMLLDERTNELHLTAQKGLLDKYARGFQVTIEDSIAGEVLETGKPQRLTSKDRIFKVVTGYIVNSILYVPIATQDEVIGVLSVDNRTPDEAFTKKDEQVLSALAGYAAIAIQNARMMEESTQRAKALSGLHAVSRSLLSVHGLQELLGVIAEKALEVLEADNVVLYEYLEETQDVGIPPIARGEFRELDILQRKGGVVPHEESVVFKLLQRNEPFYAPDAREDWGRAGFLSLDKDQKEEDFLSREKIVSSAGVPLTIGHQVVGVLFINFRSFHQLGSEHTERIEVFANQAALAINNARLFSQKERYVKELSALNQIGQVISSAATMEIDEIMQLIYEQTAKLMDVTNFYVALYDEEDDVVRFRLAVENDQYQMVGEREWKSRKGGNGLTEYVIRSEEPLLISGAVEKWCSVHEVETIGIPARSWLGAPMIVGKKVLGVVAVQNPERENVYDKGHRRVLATIAAQAAIAVDKSRLFQEVRKRLGELSALYDTAKATSEQAMDVKSVLLSIVRRAVELSNAEAGTIFLLDHMDKNLKVVVSHNLDSLLGFRMELGKGMAGRVALSGKPMIQNEYHSWEGRHPAFERDGYRDLFKAVVQVPLKWQGKVIGVLAMSDTATNRAFTEEDIRLLERFAGPATITIENARTFSYLQTLIKSSPDAIIAVDTEGIITEFSDASERIMGYRRNEIVGRSVTDLYWEGLAEARRINRILHRSEDGSTRDEETFVEHKEGNKIPIRFAGALLYDAEGDEIGSIGHLEDLREIRLLEDRYRALYEVGRVAVEVPESNLQDICREIIEVLTDKVLHFKASYLLLLNQDGDLEVVAAGGVAEKHPRRETVFKRGEGITIQVLETKGALYVRNVQRERSFERREWAKRNEVYSYLGVPLIAQVEAFGGIIVYTGEEYEFSEEEKAFLERFASLAALVIDKAKEVDRSKKMSEALREIMPDVVELSGERIFGDLWGRLREVVYRTIPNTDLGLYVCDDDDSGIAQLRESSSEALATRLKRVWRKGDTPFKQDSVVDKAACIRLEARSLRGRLEGLLVLERGTSPDGATRSFDETDRIILVTLAHAIGNALFQQRRQRHLNSAHNHPWRDRQS